MKTHFAKITRRQDTTITGTLCNRLNNSHFEINSTENEAEVTCKFCLKLMTIWPHKPMRAA